MRRADRLFEIVQILRRAKRPISALSVAAELEVSLRTVYRDIASLMAQRVPIRGEPGIGYILERGFDMPPLMLTSDELDAVVLGAHWVASRGEPELARAAQNLIAKIEASVPKALRGHIAEPATSIAPVEAPEERVDASLLRQAIRSKRQWPYHGGLVRTTRCLPVFSDRQDVIGHRIRGTRPAASSNFACAMAGRDG